MLDACFSYLKEEVWPRKWAILHSGDFYLGVIVGVLGWFFGGKAISPKLQVGTFVGAVVGYDAIALGFSIAALTLVICNPSMDVAQYFANRDSALADEKTRKFNGSKNAFSNLLFVFSWTAVIHWLFFISAVVAVMVVDSATPLAQGFGNPCGRIALAVALGLSAYCFCQFLVAILTLSQFGRIYIIKLRDMPAPAKPGPEMPSPQDGSPPP